MVAENISGVIAESGWFLPVLVIDEPSPGNLSTNLRCIVVSNWIFNINDIEYFSSSHIAKTSLGSSHMISIDSILLC